MKPLEAALLAGEKTPPEVLHDLHKHPDPEVVRHLAWHPNIGEKTRHALAQHKDPVVRAGVAGHGSKLGRTVGADLAFVYRHHHADMYLAHNGGDEDDRFQVQDRMAHGIAAVLDRHASRMADKNYPQAAIKHVMELGHEHALHLTSNQDYPSRGRHYDTAFNSAHYHSEYYDAWK